MADTDRRTAGSAPPIYRVSTSCNGVLCPSAGGPVIILRKPWLQAL